MSPRPEPGRVGRAGRPERPERSGRMAGDAGSAILEFVFVAVLVMLPLVYLVVATAAVQRSQLAVSDAARSVGRAYATSRTAAQAPDRARVALRLALGDQGLDSAALRFVAAGAPCSAPPVEPSLAPGAAFTVCVTRSVSLPGLPRLVSGRGITTVAAFVVHIDEFRAGR